MRNHKYQNWGYFFIVTGVIFMGLYFSGKKPDLLNIPTFAIASTYIENRYFTCIRTNLMDEIGFIFLVVGYYFLIFSKEQNENPQYDMLRLKSWKMALSLSLLIWLVAYIFLYGYIIVVFSILIPILLLTTYLIIFKILIYNNLK